MLLNFFSYFWATFVGYCSGYVWALVIFVKYTVSVAVWPRASVVSGWSGFVRTLVILIGYTIAIGIWTTSKGGKTGFIWTSIVLVGNTIAVSVRTSIHFFGSGLVRTIVFAVFYAIAIRIRTTVKGLKAWNFWAGIVFVVNAVSIGISTSKLHGNTSHVLEVLYEVIFKSVLV